MSKRNYCCGSITEESHAESRGRKLICVESWSSSTFKRRFVEIKFHRVKMASTFDSKTVFTTELYDSIQERLDLLITRKINYVISSFIFNYIVFSKKF